MRNCAKNRGTLQNKLRNCAKNEKMSQNEKLQKIEKLYPKVIDSGN